MIQELFDFIDKSACSYLAVQTLKEILNKEGFSELSEKENWELKEGEGYFVTRNGSSLIAFTMPEEEMTSFQISAGHCDSPSFKVKEVPEMKGEGCVRLNVEPYGGMILSSWMDRVLSLAGRVVCRDETGKIRESCVCFDRDLMIIPNLAIHMKKDRKKIEEYQVQKEFLPILSVGNEDISIRELLAEELGVRVNDILGMDLFLYNREKGRLVGADEEMLVSPRLDDLECVFGCLQGLLKGRRKGKTSSSCNVLAVFDNEEVGSSTMQGADSTFLNDVLIRIREAKKLSDSVYQRVLAESFLISADNAHSVHPNYAEVADFTNRPKMNQGIVIKYQASQRYTTDGYSGAKMKDLCDRAGVPYQTYANRSDLPGGSTLGNIATRHLSIHAVDIGLPQLAMHSALETAGAKDFVYLVKVMEEFYTRPV